MHGYASTPPGRDERKDSTRLETTQLHHCSQNDDANTHNPTCQFHKHPPAQASGPNHTNALAPLATQPITTCRARVEAAHDAYPSNQPEQHQGSPTPQPDTQLNAHHPQICKQQSPTKMPGRTRHSRSPAATALLSTRGSATSLADTFGRYCCNKPSR